MTTDRPRAAETAPSRLRAEEPTLARYTGGIGWGIVLVGLVIVTANRYAPSPRLFSEGWGWLFVLIGTVMALVHASVETDTLLRRILGIVGASLVVIGVGWAAAMVVKERSWASGLIAAVPGLFLISLFVRKEDDQAIREPALLGVGGAGLLLAAVGVLGTIIWPVMMPARFSVPIVLGLILVLMFLGLAGARSEWAYRGALGLGVIGAIALVYALLKSVVPAMLYDWRTPSELEHLVAFAAGVSLVLLGLLAILVLGKPGEGTAGDSAKSTQSWGRIALVVGGLLFLFGALRYFAPSLLTKVGWGAEPPRPFLVPTGFVLMAAGVIYGLVAVGFCSENRLVVLTRREFTTFFVSPIAYCVMAGFVLMAALSYFLFLEQVLFLAEHQQPMEEPIVRRYVFAFLPVVATMAAIPLLTMRLFSEEKRTGTLEVLLTAPVNDWLVVLSKFLGTWMFFMLLWVPWWLFLLAMRLEGGQEFDFRPMIGFMLALLACGASFTAMGLFFSSVTRDQIISAVLTFMGMMFLVGFYFVEETIQDATSVSAAVKALVRTVSFIHVWFEATQGKLFIRDIVYQLSAAVFALFATVKVLEARRWS